MLPYAYPVSTFADLVRAARLVVSNPPHSFCVIAEQRIVPHVATFVIGYLFPRMA